MKRLKVIAAVVAVLAVHGFAGPSWAGGKEVPARLTCGCDNPATPDYGISFGLSCSPCAPADVAWVTPQGCPDDCCNPCPSGPRAQRREPCDCGPKAAATEAPVTAAQPSSRRPRVAPVPLIQTAILPSQAKRDSDAEAIYRTAPGPNDERKEKWQATFVPFRSQKER